MNQDKSDYRRGLIFFCVATICIISFFAAPDGEPLLYKFIGLFGLAPGISLGASGTLYIYALVPIAIIILSARKILKYWHGYGARFKEYNALLRFLPVIIAGIIFLIFSALAL